jgi:hypothetical protein
MAPAPGPRDTPRFAPFHKADPLFFPALLVWIWIGILAGFVPEIVTHITEHRPAYPWIVHVHGLVFVGWLALLTVQIALIRSRNVGLHRRIGVIGAYWAAALVAVGVVTAVMVDRSSFGTRRWNPQFLSVQLGDLVFFAILTAFALALRREGSTHKRLMLLYDTVTRGRPNAMLLRGAALVVLGEMLIVYLYSNPGWIALTDRLFQP